MESQERRAIKATEAPALIRQERRLRLGLSQEGSLDLGWAVEHSGPASFIGLR